MAPVGGPMPAYKSLQVLRAAAALLVVCFHVSGNLAKPNYAGADAEFLRSAFEFAGSAGVTFFFVLSGFIITLRHRADVGRLDRLLLYLRKRAVRIYPTYWIVFAGVYAIAALVPSLRETVPYDVPLLAKSLTLMPQDPAVVGGSGAPVIIVAWSLQYEVMFYVVVAFFVASRRLGLAVGLALAVNAVWVVTADGQPFLSRFLGSHLALLFLMGVGAALMKDKVRRFLSGSSAFVGATGFLLVGVLSTALTIPWGLVPDLLYGAAGTLVLLSLVAIEDGGGAPLGGPLSWLVGDASYALYLLHFPLIAILSKAAPDVLLDGTVGLALAFWLMVVTCTALALVFHVVVERRVLRALRPLTVGTGETIGRSRAD